MTATNSSNFKDFGAVVEEQFNKMARNDKLFVVTLTKNEIWDAYLDAFPEGTNEVFKERREYECNTCAHFVKRIGRVVSIQGGKMVSVWDVNIGGHYSVVAKALSKLVKSHAIMKVYLSSNFERTAGARETRQLKEDGTVRTWHHFGCNIPRMHLSDEVGTEVGQAHAAHHVFTRGLRELTVEALDTVLELTEQNNLYRGEEFQKSVKSFQRLKSQYGKLKTEGSRDLFGWANFKAEGAHIRNSVIGTLLQDLSEGVDLNRAVGKYTDKVAPSNYKRPSALITQGMVDKALGTIKDLGLEDSLHRRFARLEDVSVNNVLFVDRAISPRMKDSLGNLLSSEVKRKGRSKKLDKVEEVSIDDFLDKVLPESESVEVMVENKHLPNLMSLVAPKTEDSGNLFKWGNGFSWTYNGDVADSIKQRVKAAGGNVEGYLRVSLSWFNYDDLDIHVVEPCGNEIHYRNKCERLDVDMNVSKDGSREAVENVTWPTKGSLADGDYLVRVHNYTKRESIDVGFTLEVEFENEVMQFSYSKTLRNNETVDALQLTYTNGQLSLGRMHKDIVEGSASKEEWGVQTGKFQKVTSIMLSPNHWDGQEAGNMHTFFMLDGCKNPDKARGFYNEYLRGDLTEHRKVFEILASKMKCGESEEQLSGIGFSSTVRNDVLCKVSGSSTRMVKIKF